MLGSTYIEQLPTSNHSGPLDCHNGQLEHLRDKSIPSELLGYAAHDKLMTECRYQEGDECRHVA